MRLPIDGFMVSMLAAIVLALLWPSLGVSGGWLQLALVTKLGVALIFFFAGAGLSPEKLKGGLMQWHLHAFVQVCTFVVFPLIGLLALWALGPWLPPALAAGFFYLCALPSTVSSSIAFTMMARGNVVGAIFNASASSLIGMVLTPLFVSLWLHSSGPDAPLLDTLRKIALQLLLPFALGQLARPWIGAVLRRHSGRIGQFDRGVIVLIVFNSFCDATAAGIWSRYGLLPVLIAVLMSGVLLALVLSLTRVAARRLHFPVEDEITAVFCGSKKSLAAGAPIAVLIFGGNESLGLIMLPIMVYHQIQLIACSVLARRYAERP